VQLSTQISQLVLPAPLAAIGGYQLRGTLGQGGMGVVYAAWDPRHGREVALKVIAARVGPYRDEAQARLVREARVMQKLAHPNVVAAYDVGVADGRVYVAMELVHGVTLRTWGEDPRRTFAERLRVLIDAGRGLATAHDARIVHRDVKPDNVLIDHAGRARVTDFGIARALDSAIGSSRVDPHGDTRLTTTGAILGTPAYMAPEQAEGLEVTAAADQFSFCVTAWELLSGERPFRGATAPAVIAHILAGDIAPTAAEASWPRRLRRALRRGLSPLPVRRFARMAELLAELEAVVAPRVRRRWPLIAAPILGVAVGALVGLAATGTRGDAISQPGFVARSPSEPIAAASVLTARDTAPAAPVAERATRVSLAPARTIASTAARPVTSPTPGLAASRAAAPPSAPDLDADTEAVRRMLRNTFSTVDGIRMERRLRPLDMPGYDQAVAKVADAIARADEAAAGAAMHEMRRLIDATTLDAGFIARKHARLAEKVATARGAADTRAYLEGLLAEGAQLGDAGRFREANDKLDEAGRHVQSELPQGYPQP